MGWFCSGGIVSKNKNGRVYFSWLEKLIISTGILSILIVAGSYIVNFHGKISGDIDDWAKLGDYFGGLINPFIAFLALIGIVYAMKNSRETLELSKKELEETRKELSLSRKAQQSQAKVAEEQIKNMSIQSRLEAILTAEKHLSEYSQRKYSKHDNKTMEQLALEGDVFYKAPPNGRVDSYFFVERMNDLGLLGGYFQIILDYVDEKDERGAFSYLYSIKYSDKFIIILKFLKNLMMNIY